LSKLRSLKVLDLYDTKITDVGIKELANLNDLRSLNLSGTAVTDVGLRSIATMTELTSLGLDHCFSITDDGLALLTQLKHLSCLEADNSGVRDVSCAFARKTCGTWKHYFLSMMRTYLPSFARCLARCGSLPCEATLIADSDIRNEQVHWDDWQYEAGLEEIW
jgi:hypothetical protein